MAQRGDKGNEKRAHSVEDSSSPPAATAAAQAGGGRTFPQAMRALATSNAPRRKRDINPDRCIQQIEWAAARMRDELQFGGNFLLDRSGNLVRDEDNHPVFERRADFTKIKGYALYADVYFKLLRKVQPDAVAPSAGGTGLAAADTAQVLTALAALLPD